MQGLNVIVIDNVRAPYHAEEFLNCEYERTKDGEIINESIALDRETLEILKAKIMAILINELPAKKQL